MHILKYTSSGQDERDYEKYLAEQEKTSKDNDTEGETKYDSDGFPISEKDKNDKNKDEKSKIEPLPATDHTRIIYKKFNKNFYIENKTSQNMTDENLFLFREELEVSVSGSDIPKPISTFDISCLPPLLLKEIWKVGFEKPTSIQAQAIPIALSGRDLIGLAKTGSGRK